MARHSTKQPRNGTDNMLSNILFPTNWETQKVLLNDYYNFGKSEALIVFKSLLNDYVAEMGPHFIENNSHILDKIKEILSETRKQCSITVE